MYTVHTKIVLCVPKSYPKCAICDVFAKFIPKVSHMYTCRTQIIPIHTQSVLYVYVWCPFRGAPMPKLSHMCTFGRPPGHPKIVSYVYFFHPPQRPPREGFFVTAKKPATGVVPRICPEKCPGKDSAGRAASAAPESTAPRRHAMATVSSKIPPRANTTCVADRPGVCDALCRRPQPAPPRMPTRPAPDTHLYTKGRRARTGVFGGWAHALAKYKWHPRRHSTPVHREYDIFGCRPTI